MPTGNLVFYITVDGVPGPQGSKRHVGNGRMVESSKKVKPWRKAVELAARASMPKDWESLDGPLYVEIDFHLPRPKSAPKTIDIPAIRYPDVSKLVRATEDALTQCGVWADDARIVRELTSKRYAVGEELHRIHDRNVHRASGASIKVYRA
jgi:Holliday junction resolvase RusA-like endonuclease